VPAGRILGENSNMSTEQKYSKPILMALGESSSISLLEEQRNDRDWWKHRLVYYSRSRTEKARLLPIDFSPLASLITPDEIEPVYLDLVPQRPGEMSVNYIVGDIAQRLQKAMLEDTRDITITHSQRALDAELRRIVMALNLSNDYDREAGVALLRKACERGRELVRSVNGALYETVSGKLGGLEAERAAAHRAKPQPRRLFGLLPPAKSEVLELSGRSDPGTALKVLFWEVMHYPFSGGYRMQTLTVGVPERPLIEKPLIEALAAVLPRLSAEELDAAQNAPDLRGAAE